MKMVGLNDYYSSVLFGECGSSGLNAFIFQ